MSAFQRQLQAADRFQQRQPVLALPVAVWSKFNEDRAGNLAALIAYYAFAALFPLLLVLATVLDILLASDPSLRTKLLNSALSQYPVIGPQIKANLGSIPGTGFPLAIGIVFLLLGARGVAGAMQNALCEIWGIPREDRPGFPMSQVWAMALIFTVGTGFVVTTFLSGLAAGAGHVLSGAGAYVGAVSVSLVLNVGVFWLGFRLAAVFKVPWRNLRTGAVIAAVCWQVLQVAGGYVISHQLHRASNLYGTFGIVLGLLAWLFLQAEVTLYAAETDVVLGRRLWPTSVLTAETATAPGRPAGTVSPGKPVCLGEAGKGEQVSRGRHARPEGPSSLEGQPVRDAQAEAGERRPAPPPREDPAAGEDRAAGQR
ncbi:MAG TPA: YihY/virulence factor BrkB family protein [Trebonia sp.]|nr:YihY/virulence factor BrkB family protein [Trebonia sp.]